MPRSCIKISDTVVFGIPRAALRSHSVRHQSLLIAAHTQSTFSGVLLVAGLPESGSLSTDSQPSLKCLCHNFTCAAFTASSLRAFSIIQIVSTEECSSLMQNLMQIHCSTHSVILNAVTTQYTCSRVYHPTDWYSEVIVVHTYAFQSTLVGCQVTSMSCKPFLLH